MWSVLLSLLGYQLSEDDFCQLSFIELFRFVDDCYCLTAVGGNAF